MQTTTKATKGTVSIAVDKGWLRLRWRYAGKRFTHYLGLPDTKANRKLAQAKATQIELDLQSGHFDPTIKAYKIQSQANNALTAVELFDTFTQYKSTTVASSTLDKYRALSASLKGYFNSCAASGIGITDAEKFTLWYDCQDLSVVLVVLST